MTPPSSSGASLAPRCCDHDKKLGIYNLAVVLPPELDVSFAMHSRGSLFKRLKVASAKVINVLSKTQNLGKQMSHKNSKVLASMDC